MKVNTSITINAPIDTVFRVFTDLDLVEKRINGIKSIKLLDGPAQMQVGTKWRETREFFGKEAVETMWVTELTQNKSYVVEANSRGTKYESVYTFTEVDDGTKVEMTFTGKPHSFGAKLMSPFMSLMKKSTAKAFRKDLHDLKAVAERQ